MKKRKGLKEKIVVFAVSGALEWAAQSQHVFHLIISASRPLWPESGADWKCQRFNSK
jgi:hypothetical protein